MDLLWSTINENITGKKLTTIRFGNDSEPSASQQSIIYLHFVAEPYGLVIYLIINKLGNTFFNKN